MATPTTNAKPRIILGLMGFAPDAKTGARLTTVDDLKKALDIFQARGFSELDTARAYGGGAQESFTRQAGWRERGMAIATKVWPAPPGTHAPEPLTKAFETSLKELGTDCVDVCFPSFLKRFWQMADLEQTDCVSPCAGMFSLSLSLLVLVAVANRPQGPNGPFR